MKWLALILVVFALALIPQVAKADGPQPFQYAVIKCSGMGTVTEVQQSEQVFDTQYGFDHQLTTQDQWQASFIARVNEFASSVGCGQVLQDDGTPTGSLTLWYKIYVPTYTKYLRAVQP